jgi:hypothetical protein
MSMSDYANQRNEYEREFEVDYGRFEPSRNQGRSARPNYRAKRRPTGFNGIHRRRQKRWSW